MEVTNQELIQGFKSAFVDYKVESTLAYRPQFVSNNRFAGKKVLSLIEGELQVCDTFYISVAFITLSGLEPLLQTLKELEIKGVKGKILTTDYLHFSEPVALRKLSELNNIELRMYMTDDDGFHTKGYIFQEEEIYKIIVGSSNITVAALSTNREWNTKIVSTQQGEYAKEILKEFEELWASSNCFSIDKVIDSYETAYTIVKKQRAIAQREVEKQEDPKQKDEISKLKPNSMQVGFIESLNKILEAGEKRALLISATGTGKTYASAFALREHKPKRALFVVHREQIARQAMDSYKRVFGSGHSFGILSGNRKDYDAELIFATRDTMTKEEVFTRYAKDEFSIIVVDEVHRAGAESYQRLFNYFQPDFWLGMTASPERMDGFDIFALFDHNIAYEIRLQQALDENLLCPFHYFGITDIEIEGEVAYDIDERNDSERLKQFNYLTCDARVDYILEKARYYGHSGNRVKGLIFCSRKDVGQELSEQFNKRGLRTVFLSGDASQEEREYAIERLTSDSHPFQLDYILTVDIFNEGVDTPEINQVIMLRPTKSPIIFVQQLGRGLRKAEDKEFVVILDFIGNYTNNYMIPIALSGDRSYNKDNMRRYVSDGAKIIPGASSIHFDEISRKRIYESIDKAKTSETKLLKDSYQNLKYKIGRIPNLSDFAKYATIDVTKYFDKFGSYHNFLKRYEPDYVLSFSKEQESILEFVSSKLAKGKRRQDLLVLKHFINLPDIVSSYKECIGRDGDNRTGTEEEEDSVYRVLTNQFSKAQDQEKYKDCVFIERLDNDKKYFLKPQLRNNLANEEFKNAFNELVEFGISENTRGYSFRYKDTDFQLNQKYTYEDVCMLLHWKQSMNAQNVGGYFYDSQTKTMPVFINYVKEDNAIAYEDRFITDSHLIAFSKHPRRVNSSDADHIYRRTPEDAENRIFLFVRKNKDDNEAKEFYFLGEINAFGEPRDVFMQTTQDHAFEIDYRLDTPVREDLYDYINSGEIE